MAQCPPPKYAPSSLLHSNDNLELSYRLLVEQAVFLSAPHSQATFNRFHLL